ncbi:VOC family protein [Cellvibrio sp. NN19]|uniref:VOC family protein n=1 Tax=Cellvibrio chitinivorans TaxID=3102792 RepID=UPI002B40488F|nr:VOC family protein [Cellvibrio sp. NN19]
MLNQSVGYVFSSENFNALPPSQRLHLILLGVDSIAKSRAFYEALGWIKSPTGHDEFVKFDLGGYALCLLSREALAADSLADAKTQKGFNGIAFVYLAKTPEEVPAILAKAVEAGGTLVKPATRTQWGIAGYFKDPDGYLFEVDYEEIWVFDDKHHLVVDEIKERTC